MRIYLTDCIFIEDDIYFHEKNGKIIKINENNWHIHLNEYGWNKLNRKWINNFLIEVILEQKILKSLLF